MNKILTLAAATLLFASCANESARYTDLETGKTINLEKNESTGVMVDVDTKKPVFMYVDHKTDDTIYGKTGKIINGRLIKVGNSYQYKDDINNVNVDGEIKIKDGDFKLKVDEDGDVKIKDGKKTTKIDGETGEKKVKKD